MMRNFMYSGPKGTTHAPIAAERAPSRVSAAAELLRVQRLAGSAAVASVLGGHAAPVALPIGASNDASERQAALVADRVMRAARPGTPASAAPTLLQRCACGGSCASCAEQHDEVAPLLRAAAPAATSSNVGMAPPIVHAVLAQAGEPLDRGTRAFMEPRFGADFGGVRVHRDPLAARSAEAVDAYAYTVGPHLVFGANQYAPATEAGQRLLAHELTHVVQQGHGGAPGLRRLMVHTGTTPTNCHNWRIPLTPWDAGTIAHAQINSYLGIPEMVIPRASKAHFLSPILGPLTPFGVADLWQNAGGRVGIGEIKSTASGEALATAEAMHYVLRHTEWLLRVAGGVPIAIDDAAYLALVGGPRPGFPIDLSPRTGTGINLGPFVADPLKQLWIEANNMGAVVYWCTGTGLPFSPLWVLVLKQLLNDARNRLRRIMEQFDGVLDGLAGATARAWTLAATALRMAADWLVANQETIVYVLIAMVVAALLAVFISAILTGLSGGTSAPATAPTALAGLLVAATAAAALVLVLGIDDSSIRTATAHLASLVDPRLETPASGEDYERNADRRRGGSVSAAAAAAAIPRSEAVLAAAVQSLADPVALLRNASTRPVTENDVALLRRGVELLEAHGDPTTAIRVRSALARVRPA